jgi:hypothetical protein
LIEYFIPTESQGATLNYRQQPIPTGLALESPRLICDSLGQMNSSQEGTTVARQSDFALPLPPVFAPSRLSVN